MNRNGKSFITVSLPIIITAKKMIINWICKFEFKLLSVFSFGGRNLAANVIFSTAC